MENVKPNMKGSEPISAKPVQVTQDPTSQSMAATANTTKKDFSTSTKIGSLRELKSKAPEVYKQMMMGLAQTIIKEMRRHQAKLKKMMRETYKQ